MAMWFLGRSQLTGKARIGIIGLGTQGQNHLAVLSEDKRAQIVAVCDPVKGLSDAAGKRYGANSHTDFRKLIEEEHLDAVFVVAPNAFHMEMLEFAIDQNLAIFCEKPMVITLQDAKKVSELVHQKRIKFQMGHNRRFSLVYKKTKELLETHRIKPYMVGIKMVTGEMIRPAWMTDPKIVGGFLYDTTIHMLDLTRWLFGEVSTVTCMAQSNIYKTQLDDFWITLTTTNGLMVPILSSGHASWLPPFERVEIIGDHSCIITEEMNRVGFCPGLDRETQVWEYYHLPMTTTWGVQEEDRLFVDTLLEDKPPVITVDDGFKSVELVEACYRSAAKGRQIKLPIK
jgi:myo-inositol 2-dehydrogenase/D-chiro-inositol 1-dehydrogenase